MPLTQLPAAKRSRVQGTWNKQSRVRGTVLSWSFYSPVTSGSGRQPSHAPETVSAKADRDLSLSLLTLLVVTLSLASTSHQVQDAGQIL